MKYAVLFLAAALVFGCKPNLPVTSSITIDMESATLPVNKGLYGLSMEQADFSGEGRLYAELVHNCSFDEGGDIPGWRPLSPATYLGISNTRPVNEANPLSLMVSVYSSAGRGGAVAAGKGGGFAIRKGEKYNLSFYLRTASSIEEFVPVRIALENEQASLRLSDQYEVTPSYQWRRCTYTFTATENADHAVLTFTTDRPFFFWLDSVSLVPAKTWNNRPNGFKPELMEKIQALAPAFIRYRGNREGAAFNDFLLMCKDLQTEALYGREQGRAFHPGEAFLISDHPFFQSPDYPATNSGLSISGFSAAGEQIKGTHGAAVAEACFMLHAENNPYAIDRLAYTPVVGGKDTGDPRSALMILHNDSLSLSPSYYIWQLLSRNRGDVVLQTEINTYHKPQVMPGQPEMGTPDGGFDIKDLRISSDSLYNCEVSAVIERIQDNGNVSFFVRDRICMSIGTEKTELYRLSGIMKDTLASPRRFTFKEGRPYAARIRCNLDTIRCHIGDSLLFDVVLPPLPSLVAAATYNKADGTILLKVANPTLHYEITGLNVRGASVKNKAEVMQLKGLPGREVAAGEARQSLPVNETISFPAGRAKVYKFPPKSVTVLKLTVN
jgi:hypothetical protein